MNVDRGFDVRGGFAWFLVGLVIFSGRPLQADSVVPNYSTPPEARKSVVGEAAKAVVGRVFGVQGDSGDITYNVVELTAHSPTNASIRSALIPGWGQTFNGEKVKGVVLFCSFVAASVGSWGRYQSATNSFDDYKSRGIKEGSSYDDYKRARTQSLLLGVAALGLWIGSVVDARRNAYHPVLSQNTNIDIAWTASDEGQVVWRKKF
jgi:hypothetical protein